MNFAEMIQKWMKYDYCTPGIKSEVIIDMLISEFIEEIVWFGAAKQDGTEKKDIELITKEFPFACHPGGDKRNFKADYLLADHKNNVMYVVELKTSRDSISKEQCNKYNDLKDKQFEPCLNFLQDSLINEYRYKDGRDRAATEVYGSRKYSFTACELEK
jgi:hypothetical protein